MLLQRDDRSGPLRAAGHTSGRLPNRPFTRIFNGLPSRRPVKQRRCSQRAEALGKAEGGSGTDFGRTVLIEGSKILTNFTVAPSPLAMNPSLDPGP